MRLKKKGKFIEFIKDFLLFLKKENKDFIIKEIFGCAENVVQKWCLGKHLNL